jgi:hypothetical protein
MSTSIRQVQQRGPAAGVIAQPVAKPRALDARTLALLEAPIAATLVKLAVPNILVNMAQSSVGVIETYSWASSALMRSRVLRWHFPW